MFKKSLLLAPNGRSDYKCCKMFTFSCPTSWRPEQLVKNVEITSLSPYLYRVTQKLTIGNVDRRFDKSFCTVLYILIWFIYYCGD